MKGSGEFSNGYLMSCTNTFPSLGIYMVLAKILTVRHKYAKLLYSFVCKRVLLLFVSNFSHKYKHCNCTTSNCC